MSSTPVPRAGDPRGRKALAAIAVGALVWTLTACTSPEAAPPTPSADASASVEPIFASDEEALAAAVAAYEAYLKISDAILADGGINPGRISSVTVGAYTTESENDFAAFEAAGLRTVGTTRIDSPRVVTWSADSEPATVSMYACQDVSEVRLMNATGADVTPPDRDDRIPLVLEFEARGHSTLLVSGNQVWSGTDFC